MFAHSLLSGVLLLLPIAVTVGIYIGIESQKIFNGGFDGGKFGVPGSGGSQPGRDVVETNMYCQKLIGITPTGSRYTCELSSSASLFGSCHHCSCSCSSSIASQFFLQLIPMRSLVVRRGYATFSLLGSLSNAAPCIWGRGVIHSQIYQYPLLQEY
jgi:hypothetical protein